MTTHARNELNILRIDASARSKGSVSRDLATQLIDVLSADAGASHVESLDLSQGLAAIDEAWVEANFTDADKRSLAQRETLALSDRLVAQLQKADAVVIATPIYNFGIPSTLKAWVDLVSRARLTFRYTADGPEGLLKNKKAYVVIASGGTEVGSNIDFASGYLRHVLGFLGITDVEFVAADRLMFGEESLNAARAHIADMGRRKAA